MSLGQTQHAKMAAERSPPATGQVTERRLQRAAAQQVFDALALDSLDVADVSRGRMLGSEGLVVHGK